jgi:tetratricopeptide (TPR) repeat protein
MADVMNIPRGATWALVATAVLGLAPSGCSKPKPSPSASRAVPSSHVTPAASASGPRVLRGKPKSASELPTTDEAIYLGNLDGQIKELTRLLAEMPANVSNVQRLSAAHHVRGRFRGDVDEIQLGVDGATACLRAEPENAMCFLMRAEQEQSLHRFGESRADLERARTLGVDRARATDLQTELDWNDGLYAPAIESIRRARVTRPSVATWMRAAQLEHDLDHEAEADAAFESAEDLIVDTAPLPVAHLDVQRGIQKSQRGLLEEACVFFREAVARMPTYVAALEHLGEALHALGKDDEATAIYEKVVKLSGDPEFAHALAELYAAKGKKDEARALETKAREGYEQLLRKYPEAMYWHASEFYMSIGETKRALELLRKNVTLRPNSTSWVALARAELASGKTAEAKTSIDKALAMPVRSASLFWTAQAVARARGDVAQADSLAAQAKRLNPRVATDDAVPAPRKP